ncbi:MAG TPA: D-2-hydroxyacid dehydrogenase [Thermoanaerobaculia bacterium]|nr:D-2-hydroxyacid dehydrogenase [Thermoanaerobaculia bacterium]
MRLLVIAPPSFPPLARLGQEAPEVEVIAGAEAADLRRHAPTADAVLLGPRHVSLLTDLWADLGRVRWIHSLSAGVESLPFDLLRRSDIVVTNSRALYGDALAEFAIAAMLWFAKDLRRLLRNQDARRWEAHAVERLEGTSAGIIGYGGVGQAVGRRAEALGMRVLPVRRRRELGDPSIEEVIAESDYVVLCTPLTPSTFRLMSSERLGLIRAHAVLINISRGAVVDEAALIEALRERRIRGAALDVFETEPLPPESPLWSLDNILISPHAADRAPDSHDRAMAFFLENLRRFQRGEPLENIVDKEEGY